MFWELEQGSGCTLQEPFDNQGQQGSGYFNSWFYMCNGDNMVAMLGLRKKTSEKVWPEGAKDSQNPCAPLHHLLNLKVWGLTPLGDRLTFKMVCSTSYITNHLATFLCLPNMGLSPLILPSVSRPTEWKSKSALTGTSQILFLSLAAAACPLLPWSKTTS